MMKATDSPAVRRRPLRPATVAAGYAVAAALWIAVSDWLAAQLAADTAQLGLLQTYKGWAFVAVTTVLLFALLHRGQRAQDDLLARLDAQRLEYRALFHANPNPMWVQDPETKAFLAVNDATVAHYGYSRDEFHGMTTDSLLVADHDPPAPPSVSGLVANPHRARVLRHRNKDGEPFDVELTTSALTFEGRRAELAMARDITRQLAAQRQVVDAEERLRLALAAARQGLYDLNIQTGEAMINDAYAEMLGYAPGELVETNAAWLARLHPDDRERVGRVYSDYIAGRLPEYRVEFRQRTKHGSWKWVLSLGKVMIRDASGAPLRLLGTHTDIDIEKHAQMRVRRLTNLYAALSQCNQAIVRIQDRAQLMHEICRVAVDFGDLRMAWIGEVRAGQIVPVASFGARLDYIEGVGISLDASTPAGRGPTAQALREDRRVICDDIESDPKMAPWRERALDCGFRASAAFPLHCGGVVIGVLSLYAPMARFFDDELVNLLDEMARDISFALDRFRLATEHETAERRFRTLVDHAADAVFITDLDGRIIDVNARACTSLGYEADELLAMNLTDLEPDAAGLGRGELRRIHAVAMEQDQVHLGQQRRKDGSTFPVEVRIAGMHLNEGDYLIGVARDITEQQQAEMALRDSERKFRYISRAVTDIAYSCRSGADGSFEIDWMVGAAERITGYTLDEIKAKRCWRYLVIEDDQDIFRSQVIGLAVGSRGSCELRLRRRDGGIAWVSSTAECVVDERQPERHCLYGSLVDITHRKLDPARPG